ncbi:thioredoxin domain-containing protein [Flavobacterium sp.]|uniref:thioredoxin domain-containing protein n=1 Tax=Flavobacterium sp. TaxID=239 RepID=UPI002628A3C1|nr:thioredoxin domain-containing protein [Flavobacterium sp.]
MKFRLVLPLLICCFLASCQAQTAKKYETIAPLAFAEKIKATPNAQILDVRTPEEYNDQHIDNAKNVNWNSDNFVEKSAAFDKSKPVFVYCMSGGRSKQASAKLSELGFTTIYELQGGILKWNAAGLAPKNDRIIGMCSQEYKELLNTDKKVLVNFYAEWCAPCKQMAPYMTRLQSELKDNVVIIRLNADENKTLISEMKIDELPALFLYENKEVKWQHSGFISEEDLKKQL